MIQTTQNRNESFLQIAESLPKKRQRVYQMINRYGITSPQEICEKYDFKFNEIAPRFTELRNSGHIKIVDYRENERSKHKNAVYSVTTPDEMINITNRRYQELVDKKDKLVSDLIKNLSPLTKEMVVKEVKKIDNQLNNL
tara:strand:- start:328 stop:747 length:420 start_codon:yes stop_codon:yes gene_type:complete